MQKEENRRLAQEEAYNQEESASNFLENVRIFTFIFKMQFEEWVDCCLDAEKDGRPIPLDERPILDPTPTKKKKKNNISSDSEISLTDEQGIFIFIALISR